MKALILLSLLVSVSFSTVLKAEETGTTWGSSYDGASEACEAAKNGVDHVIRNDDRILISKADTCYDCKEEEDNIGTNTTCLIDFIWDYK